MTENFLALRRGTRRARRVLRHYGATNHKEYFAEATEAYLYHNDFYPFVAAELKDFDPKAFAVMKEVWGPAAVK